MGRQHQAVQVDSVSCSDQQLTTSTDFPRSPSVTSSPPRNGSFSSSSGIKITKRKSSANFAEKRNHTVVMAKEQENYFPSGYTKCDLKATFVPTFQISNARAWTNPTPTPWGRDRVNLEFTQSSSSTAKMDSKSGVVGKFRSFYSTIEQVKAAFLQYDINRDGNISRQELEDGMVQSGQFSFDEARTAFDIAEIVQLMFPNAAEIISQMKRNRKKLKRKKRKK